MIASLADYLPLSDLAKIIVVCLAVAVVAPAAVSVAVAGLDVRARRAERHAGELPGLALIALGVIVLGALVGAGIYALITD